MAFEKASEIGLFVCLGNQEINKGVGKSGEGEEDMPLVLVLVLVPIFVEHNKGT